MTYELKDYQSEDDSKLISEIVNHEAAIKLMNWLREQKIDEVYASVYRASFLQLNEKTAPRVMECVKNACRMFGLQEEPVVYVNRDFDGDITVGGISAPFVLISSRYLEKLEHEKPHLLPGVIAGQVAGIQAGHHRGLLLLWLLETAMSLLPIPRAVMMTLEGLLNNWKRCRNYTCDRAAYLALGDYSMALECILLDRVPVHILDRMGLGTEQDVYQSQVEAFTESSGVDSLINVANSLLDDTDWLPVRCAKLAEFVGKGDCANDA